MAFGCNCEKLLPKCRWFDSGPRDPFFLHFFTFLLSFFYTLAITVLLVGLTLPEFLFFSCLIVGRDNGCSGRMCGDRIGALCIYVFI
ncbi:uncharacterized protein F4817DRAFT_330896 [Daldinia loculata]|uniref:uncharacterized protein n=1 Tax=Daldinia loculata TaxID=103429 RepID=UPI0020C1D47B|nr:uncharacterized protein F4817DRAFT_330896 [Daldinia loculata]KAI1649607.1 hypothetical protein F4817DRAFT_330896 [Daldinia loculata]